MTKLAFILVLVLMYLSINAQNQKFNFHSLNVGFGGFYIKNNIAVGGGGTTLILDLTTSFDKNLFAASYLTGKEIGIVGNANYGFNEISALYGRELKLSNWFAFELFAGLGFYNQNSVDRYIIPGNVLSFPLKINTKFNFNKRFGMGLNSNYSINELNNNFSTNLILFWRYN